MISHTLFKRSHLKGIGPKRKYKMYQLKCFILDTFILEPLNLSIYPEVLWMCEDKVHTNINVCPKNNFIISRTTNYIQGWSKWWWMSGYVGRAVCAGPSAGCCWWLGGDIVMPVRLNHPWADGWKGERTLSTAWAGLVGPARPSSRSGQVTQVSRRHSTSPSPAQDSSRCHSTFLVIKWKLCSYLSLSSNQVKSVMAQPVPGLNQKPYYMENNG